MTIKDELAGGVVHSVPADLKKTLISSASLRDIWQGLTPLARNEWICWVEFVKKEETRREHIERVRTKLLEGKRRPCCWIGCPHRTDKPISPSVSWVLSRKSRPH